jgi:hypothetical protein
VTKAEATILKELAGSVQVVRNQQLETNRILKLLAGVLTDLQVTAEGLRQELSYLRTSRERSERAAALAELAGVDQHAPEAT